MVILYAKRVKHIFLLHFFIVLTSLLPIFAQELSESSENVDNQKAKVERKQEDNLQEETKSSPNKTLPWSFFFGVQAINYADTTISSQITNNFALNAMIGTEYMYEINPYVAIAPAFSFSVVHYGNSNHHVSPADLENRIATALFGVLDVPVLGVLPLGNWRLSLGGGISFLLRGAFRAVNVSGVTSDDVAEVNRALWAQGRFIAPSIQMRVAYTLESGWRIACFGKSIVPISNLWAKSNGKKMPFYDGLMTQFGITIFFPTEF